MQGTQGTYRNSRGDITNGNATGRRAVGYIRVSTDLQAADGLSLDAQNAAIEQYCAMTGLRLVQILVSPTKRNWLSPRVSSRTWKRP